jgi:hypothetical protein
VLEYFLIRIDRSQVVQIRLYINAGDQVCIIGINIWATLNFFANSNLDQWPSTFCGFGYEELALQ